MLSRKIWNKINTVNHTSSIVYLAREININKLSPEILTVGKQLIRDGIGVLILGMGHETILHLNDHFKEEQTVKGIQVLNNEYRVSVSNAAFIYGCAIHSMDFEPMFLPPTHAVSPVLAALITLAQKGEGDGELFLKSFLAGIQFEADLRKGAFQSDVVAANSERHFPFERNGFHPPGTVGPLGSALASSIFLNSSEEQTCMAIGMSASRSCGISGNIGTQTKSTHCGTAARSGLESALLVRSGLTASNSIIDAPSGWGQIFGGENFNYEQLTEGMKNLECFLNPGFGFKKWPAHTAMQVTIATGLKLFSKEVPTSLKITAPVFKYCNRPFPKDSDEARFSFQYNAIVGVLDGEVTNSSYSEERLFSEDVQNLLRNTEINLDNSIPKDFGQMHVVIETNDGRKAIGDRWPGHWKSPMKENELLEKFVSCTEQVWNRQQAIEISKLIMNLEKGSNFESLVEELNNLSKT